MRIKAKIHKPKNEARQFLDQMYEALDQGGEALYQPFEITHNGHTIQVDVFPETFEAIEILMNTYAELLEEEEQ